TIPGVTVAGKKNDGCRRLRQLFERGAKVVYGRMADEHVSGRGSRDEMQAMIEAVRPQFMIPAHGEPRHLHLHAQLAVESGMPAENVFVLKNGAQWVTDGQAAWTDEPLAVDDVFVDGRLTGEIG